VFRFAKGLAKKRLSKGKEDRLGWRDAEKKRGIFTVEEGCILDLIKEEKGLALETHSGGWCKRRKNKKFLNSGFSRKGIDFHRKEKIRRADQTKRWDRKGTSKVQKKGKTLVRRYAKTLKSEQKGSMVPTKPEPDALGWGKRNAGTRIAVFTARF